jgi:dTDP-4-dehydrorhamnose reductase
MRADPARAVGIAGVLRQCWERYRAPIAVTEVHNGCTREEQMRWFHRVWRDTETVRAEGVDVRAVTAWALIGSHGWDKLCCGGGTYETGVFDARGPELRATAMAPLLRDLARGRRLGTNAARLLKPRGWWETQDMPRDTDPVVHDADDRPLLIVGRTGTLGQALARDAATRNLPHLLTDRAMLDVTDPRSIDHTLDSVRPWAVINTAGLVDLDRAEREPERNAAQNTAGAANLARACAARGMRFITISTDQVFDGANPGAYLEPDVPNPLNAYGRAKAAAEAAVLAAHPDALVARTSAFFSADDPYNFAWWVLGALSRNEPVRAASDNIVSPTYVPDLTRALLDLLVDGESGIWHLANDGVASWADFAHRLADAAKLDSWLVQPVPAASLGWTAPRPPRVQLASVHGPLLPSLDDAVERMAAAWAAAGTSGQPPGRVAEALRSIA